MAIKWSPQLKEFDQKTLLGQNKKVGILNAQESTPLVRHDASNLVDSESVYSRLRDSVSQTGEAVSSSSASLAAQQNQVRQAHNTTVDDKIEAENFMKAYQQSQETMKNGQYSLSMRMNPNADAFGMSSEGGMGSLAGLGLNGEQQRIANDIIMIGRQRGLSDSDIRVGLMTGLAESGLKNVKYGDRDSQGVFQQRPSQGWGTVAQVTNTDYSINKFYDALGKSRKGKNEWNTAQNVQRSAFADGSNYRAQAPLAGRILAAANNPSASAVKSLNNSSTGKWLQSQVGKKHDFDGAYGTQCVDFFRYYNQYLGFQQPPSLSTNGGSGGAKDLWENSAQRSAMSKNYNPINKNQKSQMGDVVVFNGNLGAGYGHVGVVIEDKGGKLKIINSNSSTVGNGKATNIVTLNKNNVSGYYRPKGK